MSSSATLPPLRDDIEMLASGDGSHDGTGWVLYDPLQHRYFAIDEATKGLLSIWNEKITQQELSELATSRFGLIVDVEQIGNLVKFLRANHLTAASQAGAWRNLALGANAGGQPIISRLVHHYLFFKIPLFRPQRALQAALPHVEVFYGWQTGLIVSLLGLIGIYLTSRQWESFVHSLQGLVTLEGAFWFGLSLVVVKVLHELGHAFTAARFGCRVPTMGVAFMVMMPLLYTDVTDAWRLESRRQRLLIHAAGIVVEIGLACIATFVWAFLPDGPVRSAVFVVATTGWVLSLGLNLNPLMKFDGYFLLSDFLGIANLQSRAFELGRWKLRQVLLAPSLEPPEALPARTRNGMIVYAWSAWIYRLIVFTGIAVVVYHFCFKALGIVLFAVEIWIFIVRPIVKEIGDWRNIEPHLGSSQRSTMTIAGLFVVCVIVFLPWSATVEVPAVLRAADLAQVYPVRPAKVASVESALGDRITAGTAIARLVAPEIDKEIDTTRISIDLVKLRLGRVMADDTEREQYLVLARQLAGLQSRLDGLLSEKDELVVRSPFSGTVVELGPDMHPGRWLGKSDLIALIASQKKHVVRGYVPESELRRIRAAATGRFVPDDLTRPTVSVRLLGVARAGAAHIDIPELSSVHGGQIATDLDAKQRLIPHSAQYLVELEPQDAIGAPNQLVRGVVELQGASTSIFARAVRSAWHVLIRESGF